MNKKAFYGLLIALIIPVVIFFYLDALPKANIPKPLFIDSVGTEIRNGKKVEVTHYKRIPDFTLTNQLGKKVSFSDFALSDSGKITVVDFFFTRCPTICPGMTLTMKQLQRSVQKGVRVGNNTADFVQFVSITIDPERDSVQQLKKWADRFQIDPVNWHLLTGDKQTIYDLSLKHMNLTIADPKIDTTFPHTDMFVLIDKYGVVRARQDKNGNPLLYHSGDQEAMTNLAEDIVLLSLEKDPNERSFFEGKLMIMATAFIIAIIAVGVLLIIFKKKEKNAAAGS